MKMLIDGKKAAAEIKECIKSKVQELDKRPGLAVVKVGDDPASKVYVSMKEKVCKDLGFYSEKHELDEDTTEDELLNLVEELNSNGKIHGILVQLPLPGHISEDNVIEAISFEKDVDGFHPFNLGRLMHGSSGTVPCTPKGIMYLLKSSGIEIEGKDAVVVGRSNIVGKPVAQLLLQENCTVTVCHSRTKNLSEHTKKADILVVCVGKPNFIDSEMIKEGAVVIDVGVNRTDEGLKGDVDFESVKDKASAITPVPGGVGPMTIAMLMQNTYDAFMEVEKC